MLPSQISAKAQDVRDAFEESLEEGREEAVAHGSANNESMGSTHLLDDLLHVIFNTTTPFSTTREAATAVVDALINKMQPINRHTLCLEMFADVIYTSMDESAMFRVSVDEQDTMRFSVVRHDGSSTLVWPFCLVNVDFIFEPPYAQWQGQSTSSSFIEIKKTGCVMRNQTDTNRRDFLKIAGAGTVASLACLNGEMAGSTARAAESEAAPKKVQFTLAMASYTLRKFDLDQTLAMTKQVGLTAICLKSFHLPMDATVDEIKAVAAKVEAAGLTLYGGGVIGMKSEEQINQAFEYAKTAGMIKIVAAPTPEMLPLIDRKVKEYDIQVCIHNHGPGDKHFPTPTVGYDKIKGFDKRIGFCHDIGHTVRYGEDAIAATEKCADRILDVHMKDVTEATKKGHATPCGRGIIDIPAFVRTLVKTGYSGYVAFEYEEDPNDPMAGLAESVDYTRKVIDTL